MMKQLPKFLLSFFLVTVVFFGLVLYAFSQAERSQYLPVVYNPEATATPTATATATATATPTATPKPGTMIEFRGLWVTRFDWTNYNQPADPARIDEIVANAALANFNVIFFQVRGAADAYYTPGLEPWAQRVSGGALGQPPDPYWDPLAYMINAAHARGIQVHAYINVYPVWDRCDSAPPATSPTHFYYLLQNAHGVTDGKLNGLQWDSNGNIHCSGYQRSSPASGYGDEHILAVARDLVTRYDIDGIHLDHIRYGGTNTSYDPVSQASYDGTLSYAEWQRTQVNGTVWKFYTQIVPLKPQLWLSAAVWPIYYDYWGWGIRTGYSDYYQDSKAWIRDGYIDSISPMIYSGSPGCPDESFWTQSRWQTLAADFQGDSYGRYVIPGIGAAYCDFAEIESRIQMARSLGTAGQALFSYGDLFRNGYFDDLATGPYVEPALVPGIPWHE